MSESITAAGPQAVATFDRVCRTCGKPVRPHSLICVGCGAALGRVPKHRQASMVVPAFFLMVMLMVVLHFVVTGLQGA